MFQVHGEWQISVENNYILQRFSGCWNKEAAINYWQEFTEKKYYRKSRGHLFLFWMTGT